MPVLISHNSALELLRSVPSQVFTPKQAASDLIVSGLRPWRGMNDYPTLQAHGLSFLPVHFLVPSNKHQVKSSVTKLHRTSIASIPKDLVREVSPGVFVSGPELTFIQMASTTSLIGAVVLGHELCGTYSHFAKMASGFYERPPLTSVAKIENAIESLQGMYGLSRARAALRWVRDGSASPMETVVSCMLHLPVELGGFGKQAPKLNHVVKLDEASQRITGKKTCRIDTAYPDTTTGMEFDGASYHRDTEKDRVRREALAHEGWTIYVVNVDEMSSYEELKKKVDLMNSVPQMPRQGEVDAKLGGELLERLLRATRFGVGLNGTLFGATVPRGKVKIHV